MIGIRLLLCALLALLPIAQVQAWGVQGHETVGAIADSLLNPVASARVSELLHGNSLATVSIWPDCAKYPDGIPECAGESAAQKAAWLPLHDFDVASHGEDRRWHYTTVDIHQPRYQGTPSDVVHSIQRTIRILQGSTDDAATSRPLSQAEALFMLTHIVGDIHQPLHVGELVVDGHSTAGSTLLYARAGGCLHADWDNRYVDAAEQAAGHAGNPQAYAAHLLQRYGTAALDGAPLLARPELWANESLDLARSVALQGVAVGAASTGSCGFADSKPTPGWAITLPPGYDTLAQQTAERQVWHAGLRLAQVLNEIWPVR